MLKSLKNLFFLFSTMLLGWTTNSSNTGWVEGKIQGFNYCLKVYQQPSVFGINGGKISKLEIRKNNVSLVNYDRGWDSQPRTEELEKMVDKLIGKFDSSSKGFTRV